MPSLANTPPSSPPGTPGSKIVPIDNLSAKTLTANILIEQHSAVAIYSTSTGRIRRFIQPDDTKILPISIGVGESALPVPAKNFGSLSQIQAIVSIVTGKFPAKDRYVVIDQKSNIIVGAILADPLCGDAIVGFSLVQHDTADVNWSYVQGVLTPPPPIIETQAEIDARQKLLLGFLGLDSGN